MLQRAADNAYSWWWASHIRTKQSRWLELSLQDMKEKVQHMLKLIEEDGDSFAKRAEMYYRKRPELINFVEESYRAYRALAERYDHISTELQNANNTIAYAFPEQVPLPLEEVVAVEEPMLHENSQHVSKSNIPKVLPLPKDLKGISKLTANKLPSTKTTKPADIHAKSAKPVGLTKLEGQREIDRLQKKILALQTEKEFFKSSCESGLEKYWEIEQEIREIQEKVCSLQDEFGVGIVFEDGEAQVLMAAAALKTCHHKLKQLQEKHMSSEKAAVEQHATISDAREKLNLLKKKAVKEGENPCKLRHDEFLEEEMKNAEQEVSNTRKESEKLVDNFIVGSVASLTVAEVVEQIDDLVNKVIGLESSVLSQMVLIQGLQTETLELQSQILILEEDEATLISEELIEKLREMEEKLPMLQYLNSSIDGQDNNLEEHISKSCCNHDHLSDRLLTKQPNGKNEVNSSTSCRKEEKPNIYATSNDMEPIHEEKSSMGNEYNMGNVVGQNQPREHLGNSIKRTENISEQFPPKMNFDEDNDNACDKLGWEMKLEEQDWKELFLNGMEDRERIRLSEYTRVLQNYKEVKKQLSEIEKKGGDNLFDATAQLCELKSCTAKKYEQIMFLKQKLSLLQTSLTLSEKSQPQAAAAAAKTEDVKVILVDQARPTSEIEDRIRKTIDQVLEENLDFWLRFSAAFHQMQKFVSQVHDLHSDSAKHKLEEQQNQQGETEYEKRLRSGFEPRHKHLEDVHGQLCVWMEEGMSLQDELKRRLSSLCDVEEEVVVALKESATGDDFQFTSYQAARFQGEILNMKQENNKVADELQAGIERITTLQLDVDKTLAELKEETKIYSLTNNCNVQLDHVECRSRVPLRSFIFGIKSRKPKHSVFSCMHPAVHKKYRAFK